MNWSFDKRAWLIVAALTAIWLLLFLRMYYLGLSGIAGSWSVLAIFLVRVGFIVALARLGFLAFYAIDRLGWTLGRRTLVPLFVLVLLMLMASQLRFSWAFDAGNRQRLSKVVDFGMLTDWAAEHLDEHRARGSFIELDESGFPEEMIALLRSSGRSRLVIMYPGEVGNDACVRFLFGSRDFRWGVYLGREWFVPAGETGVSWYKWADGLYGWVHGVP